MMVLFPHPNLPDTLIRRILSFAPSLAIFRPWFWEPSENKPELRYPDRIRVRYPPVESKPPETFSASLLEYKRWMDLHPGRNRPALLKFQQGQGNRESSASELKEFIKQGFVSAPPPGAGDTLKWHFVLHLAQELEHQCRDADAHLNAIRHADPLEGSVNDSENWGSVLSDLPEFELQPLFRPSHHRLIVEAWFGLFGSYVAEEDMFITTNRDLFTFITQFWEERIDAEIPSLRITVPLPEGPPPTLSALALKRGLCRPGWRAKDIFDSISAQFRDSASSGNQATAPESLLHLQYFPSHPSLPDGLPPHPLTAFSEKMLALMEEPRTETR